MLTKVEVYCGKCGEKCKYNAFEILYMKLLASEDFDDNCKRLYELKYLCKKCLKNLQKWFKNDKNKKM